MRQGAGQGTRRQVLFVAALALAVTAFLSVAAVRHGFFDLKVYYGALNYWAHGDGQVYDYLKPNSKYGFTYPPFAALVMLPMAVVPWPVAIVISAAATVVTSALLIWWLLDPISRRQGWTRWFAFAVAVCLAAAFEPMRETFTFGQVNMLLLFLVAADLLWLVARDGGPGGMPRPARYADGSAAGMHGPAGYSRWAGVGIGLATAIKLTPGIFIGYLLVTGRWRAAATASGTAVAATLLAAAIAPDATREFWTEALWDTDRIGSLAFVSNQSLQGAVARLDPAHPSVLLWLALVVVTLGIWVRRARAAASAGDAASALALTGVVGCLVSPVTWVHHLVWLIPALVLLADNAYAAPAGSRRRRGLLGFAAFAYLLLCSRFVWIWEYRDASGVIGFVGSSAYVWVSLALLLVLPIRGGDRAAQSGARSAADKASGVPDLGERRGRPSPRPMQVEAGPLAIGH